MSNKKNNDLFEQLVKSKLADYNAEVPPLGWEKLESSLLTTQKTKVVRRKWIISSLGAIAAALIGVFFVFQNINKEQPIHISENRETITESNKTHKTETTTDISESSLFNKKRVETKESTEILVADNVSTRHYKTIEEHSSPIVEKQEKSSVIISSKVDEKVESKAFENEKETSKYDEATKQQLIEDFINEGERSLASSDGSIISKRRAKKSISLTGQSGLLGSQQTSSTPNTLRSSLSDTYGMFALNKMTINNGEDEEEIKPESEINHMQPVSFGVLTTFELTSRFQLETGLVYTYLSSETKSKFADYNESEKVQFHYLGVPLNLNYTLFSINKLNMFVSAGAMIEKDISGRINYSDEKKTSAFNSGYASNKSSKIKQQNPQFSISSGLGITYPIYDNTKLFGKIGGKYYIKANNEFRTYYSDEKFGLNLQFGIKFNL